MLGSMTTPATGPARTSGAAPWTIAQIAEHFGVTHRTVRHYEALGLIAPERRGTRRLYHRRERIRMELILRGRRLGFPLEEIRRIIDMYDDQPGEAGQLRYLVAQIESQRAVLEERLRDVQDALAEIDRVRDRCLADLARLEGG